MGSVAKKNKVNYAKIPPFRMWGPCPKAGILYEA
jgi:hypothetical protein